MIINRGHRPPRRLLGHGREAAKESRYPKAGAAFIGKSDLSGKGEQGSHRPSPQMLPPKTGAARDPRWKRPYTELAIPHSA